jgi:hypothetical protein
MHTRVLARKYFGKEESRMFMFEQTHWCYVLPAIMFNLMPRINMLPGEKTIHLIWLFWEVSYTWNLRRPASCCGCEKPSNQ